MGDVTVSAKYYGRESEQHWAEDSQIFVHTTRRRYIAARKYYLPQSMLGQSRPAIPLQLSRAPHLLFFTIQTALS